MDDIPLSLLSGILVGLFALSAFFSGSETALMSLNRYRLRHLADKGHKGAIRAQKLLEKPDRLIGLILLGNNFINVLITQLATYIGLRLFGDAGLAIATGVLTLSLLIFAEVAPKTLAALHSEKIAFPAAFVYVPLLTIAYPLVWLVNMFANGLLYLFGLRDSQTNSNALSQEELRTVVNEAGALIPQKNQKMLLGVLNLDDTSIEDIMIPRNEIEGLDLVEEAPWEDIFEQLINTQYTRLVVYKGSLDDVKGMLHIRDVMPLIAREQLKRQELEEALREIHYIPEGTSLRTQLVNFQTGRYRIGLVVDEYGDIQGLVTLDDLLEEIVGEFTTDPGDFSKEIHPQEDGTFLIEGSAHIREINRALQIELPSDGARTLNGLILEHLESFPEAGTSILVASYPIEVVQLKENSIKTAKIHPPLTN